MVRPRQLKRYVLVLLSFLVFGNTYCYDNPGALKSQLQQRFHDIPKAQYENLSYSLYSVPNVILPFFGGLLVDKYGVRTMTLGLSVLLLLGQIVVALGCSFKNFYLILVGRVIFGLGGETMWVAQSTFMTQWFDSTELAFAFGVNTCIARMGTVLNDKLSPVIADEYSVSSALWLGVFFCVASLLCNVLLAHIDRRAEAVHGSLIPATDEETTPPCLHDIKGFSWSFWVIAVKYVMFYACIGPFNNVASSLFMEREYFKQPPTTDCQRCGLGAYTIDCDSIAQGCPPVPPFAWPLPELASNCSIATAFDQYRCAKGPPFISDEAINCDDAAWRAGPFTHKYCAMKSAAAETAASSMSVAPLIVAFLAPVAGSLIDAVGLRPLLALLAEVALVVAHTLIGFAPAVPVLAPLVLIGVGGCFFSSTMWPCVPYVVEPRFVGTAFGAMTSFSNMGLAVVPLLVASVLNASGKYIPDVTLVFLGAKWMRGSARQKRAVVLLSSVFAVGSTYCYDIPSALKSQLQQHFHHIPKPQFELFFNLSYSLYSIPNVLLPFFGGVLIDTYGVAFMALSLASLILGGQIICAIGSSVGSIYVMLLGRLCLGLGGETLWVAQTTFLTNWLEPTELAFAIGINNCIATLGTLLNDMVSPPLASAVDVSFALWVGAAVCVFSLGATMLLARMESSAPPQSEPRVVVLSDLRYFRQALLTPIAMIRSFIRLVFWLVAGAYLTVSTCTGALNNIAGSMLLERDYFREPPVDCRRCGLGAYAASSCDTIAPTCPSVPPFAWPLPQLAANCSIESPLDQYRCGREPPYIQDDGINCDAHAWRRGPFTHKYCAMKARAAEKATTMMAITPLVSAVAAPFSGGLVDAVGWHAGLGLASEVAILASHVLLGYSSVSVAPILALTGLGQSLFAAAMWSAVPLVVAPRHVSTAFGAITSFSNMGLAIVPIVVANVYNRKQRYLPTVENLFVGLAAVAVGFGIALVVASRGSKEPNLATVKTNDNSARESLLSVTAVEDADGLWEEAH
ncbi:Major Facilitator Superfamily (MFS) [Achlya hypogyna]|uniref:Lysosomal dipeptide transporter MFSD1 n=1 Tax=Achlya hypogyna TaxID=1202772 RepID=A0A1V9YNE3_ACHHY|nr:Major Facilitator Superfamily (MFS) [Achlya hypogyna]